MQLLQDARKVPSSHDACAREVLDTVPLLVRVIRQHMRRHRSGLTIPQFRTLCYVDMAEGSSLSSVADFIGLSLPAMSRLVDGLVEKRLMKRRPCDDDRRSVRLSVTVAGNAAIGEARELAQAQLAKALARLSSAQRNTVVEVMRMLHDVFAPELCSDDANGRHARADH